MFLVCGAGGRWGWCWGGCRGGGAGEVGLREGLGGWSKWAYEESVEDNERKGEEQA